MRRRNQTAKAAVGESDLEQLLVAEYGASYNPATREAFHEFLHLRTLFAAWDDRDKPRFKNRWGHKWPDVAALRAEIDDAKVQALSDFYIAITSGDGTFFRAFATAVETDKRRWQGQPVDRHRYWIVELFKNPFSFANKMPRPTIGEVKRALDNLTGGNIDAAQIRRYCKELNVVTREDRRGRPKGSKNVIPK